MILSRLKDPYMITIVENMFFNSIPAYNFVDAFVTLNRKCDILNCYQS